MLKPEVRRSHEAPFSRREVQAPDLQSQYEELLDTVWRCERRANLMDRIDARARFDARRDRSLRWRR